MDILKKLMTLADGQVLYKDLRKRISETSVAIIDDESGQGDTDKVWSADKTYNELSSKINEPSEEGTNGQVLSTDGEGGRSWTTVDISNKADKENTILDTTLSRGRSGNTGTGSFAFGSSVIASGEYSHAEGIGDTGRGALGKADHAEGYQTRANSGSGSSAYGAHAEGHRASATADGAHAEGTSTTASAEGAHAEGGTTTASAQYSHAEGMATTASGKYSHAEGYVTKATATAAHAEGYTTTASGTYSHAEGMGTVANHAYQHAFGSYNIADPSTASASNRGNYIEIVGKGSASSAKKNARTLDWNGNERLSGDVYVGCNDDSSGGTKLAKITDIPSIPIDDTAGSGDTDKIWSADKIVSELSDKADSSDIPDISGKLDAPSVAGTTGQFLSLNTFGNPIWKDNTNVISVTVPVMANSGDTPRYANVGVNLVRNRLSDKSNVIGYNSATEKYYTSLSYTLNSSNVAISIMILPGAPSGSITLFITDVNPE